MPYWTHAMDTIMAEGIGRPFDSAEDAARDLVATMQMHLWQGDVGDAVQRLTAGETLEHGRHTYRVTVEE